MTLPLRLRAIPPHARLSLVADDGMGATIVAIGKLAHEAAAEIERLRLALKEREPANG